MPDRWIDGLKTVEEDGVTKYRVSLDYPEIMPFMDNADSEYWRRELFLKNQCKGGKDNVAVLEEAIKVRAEIATLLGYDSWAAYVVEKRMSKTRQAVDAFLADLGRKLAAEVRGRHAGAERAPSWSTPATRRATSGTGGTTPTGCTRPSTPSTTSRSPTTSRSMPASRGSSW